MAIRNDVSFADSPLAQVHWSSLELSAINPYTNALVMVMANEYSLKSKSKVGKTFCNPFFIGFVEGFVLFLLPFFLSYPLLFPPKQGEINDIILYIFTKVNRLLTKKLAIFEKLYYY